MWKFKQKVHMLIDADNSSINTIASVLEEVASRIASVKGLW